MDGLDHLLLETNELKQTEETCSTFCVNVWNERILWNGVLLFFSYQYTEALNQNQPTQVKGKVTILEKEGIGRMSNDPTQNCLVTFGLQVIQFKIVWYHLDFQ